ncbi:hypothetical protein ACHAO9_008503 [Fusarium lateritium]
METTDNYHVTWLGKNPRLTDPSYEYAGPSPLLESLAEKEHRRANEDDSRDPMLSARQKCADHGYGRESVWPPFDPGRPHKEFQEEIRKRGSLVQQWWAKLNNIVGGKELVIQEAILKLADGNMVDENWKPLTIEQFLEESWELARDAYNAEMPEPRNIESDFYLDPDGKIAMTRSNDLDTFALDFSAGGQERTTTKGFNRYYPLYRHGGNYSDMRPDFDQAMLSDDKFQTLRKPELKRTAAYTFNRDVEGIQRKQRASLLVPHINLEDLTNPLFLLKFVHHRARYYPKAFLRRDRDRTYLGKSTRLLCGACDPHCFVNFEKFGPVSGDKTAATFQLQFIYKEDLKHDPILSYLECGLLYGSMEAWLIMQTQVITYRFLTKFCQQMLDLGKEREVDDHCESLSAGQLSGIKKSALRRINYLATYHYPETWQDVDSSRQYEVDPDTLEVKRRYLGILATKKLDAEEHIRRLFDEPDYFVNLIMEQKEHHWTNLRNQYGSEDRGHHIWKYEDDATRHDFYFDCTRNVLRRAFFEFFIWNTVSEALQDLESLDQKVWNEAKRRLHANVSTGDGVPSLKPDDDIFAEWRQLLTGVHMLVRQAAAFFVFEFRKRAIHAASQSTRDIWHIDAVGRTNPKHLKEIHEYYDSEDIPLKIREQTMKSERLQHSRMVAELIENFISDETSSMYVGMRKTTARILRHIEDCEEGDQEEETFSDLIKTTASGLNVLTDIGEHLSCVLPRSFGKPQKSDSWELETRKIYSDMLEKYSSYDILALGDCSLSQLPAKRTERVYRFLDEMQGIGKKPEESFGKAKTDIKRFGASILEKLIVPLNKGNVQHGCKKWGNLDPRNQEKPVFQAKDSVLERLRMHMGINESDWVFSNNEKPEDAQARGSKEEREESKEIWLDLRKILSKRQQEYKNAWKKKLQEKRNVPTDQFDFIADEVSRLGAIDAIRKHRYEKNQETRREKRRQKLQREEQLNSEPVEVDMRDAPLQQSVARSPSPEENTDDLGHDEDPLLPAMGELQLEPQPQPVPQQPADEPPPAPPQSPLNAPDGKPRGVLNKHCWEAWRRILVGDIRYTKRTGQKGKQKLPDIRWHAVEDAIKAIGFRFSSSRGSHRRYVHTVGCRWPESVVAAFVIDRPHGAKGSNQPVSDRVLNSWRDFLKNRKLTFESLKAWYRQK